MKKYKRTLKEDIALIVKGYKLLWKMSPANVMWRFLYCISFYVSPFFSLYMSSLLINEIVAGASFERLLTLSVITVSGNLFLKLLSQTVIGRFAVDYEQVQWYRNEKMMTDAEARMQYKHLEDPEIALMASKIRHYTYYGSNGIMQLYWSIWFLTQGVFNLVTSVVLTASMFTMSAQGDFQGFLAFANSPASAFAILGMIIVNVVVQVKCSANKREKQKDAWNGFSVHQEKAFDMMRNTEDLHVFGAREFISRKTKNVFQRPKYIFELTKINTHYSTISIIWNVIMNLGLFIYIGAKAYIGVFGIGSFVLYHGTVGKFIEAVSTLGSQIGGIRYNNDYLKELFDYIELPSEMNRGSLPVEKTDKYEIEFKNVSFKYTGAEDFALKNINFKFALGERLAFVGMNGSGKTTFIKLLCRLYEPDSGEIFLNGINIKDYNYEEYLSLFSVVFQDFAIFAYDVASNVSASHNPDREKVMDCLERAGLGEKIKSLPNGIDTYITRYYDDEGVDFSKGECQKIAIARALYKDAPFIILDEPTAALDPLAEAEIYGKFNEIVNDRTAVYISHRLSSCKFCDRIVVFHEGEILQTGSHDALLKDESGKYSQLWQAQAQYYTE